MTAALSVPLLRDKDVQSLAKMTYTFMKIIATQLVQLDTSPQKLALIVANQES